MGKFQRDTTVKSAKKGFRMSGDTGGLNRPIGGSGDGIGRGPMPPGSYDPQNGRPRPGAAPMKVGGYGATPQPNPVMSKLKPRENKAYAAECASKGYGASGIHIKPSHKGLLHKDLGVPEGQKIPKAKIAAAKNSPNPKVRKRATFAQNFGHDAAPKGGKMEKTMHEFKHGELHSGSKTGPEVTNRKQAIAIGLSQARKAGEE